jgi:hypothetical protein
MRAEGPYWTVESVNRLVVAKDGQVCTYRVEDGDVEFQATTGSPWHRLSAAQIGQHVAIETVVGRWLERRIYRNGAEERAA